MRAGGVKIAEVGRVYDVDVRAECMLGAVEVEVAIGRRWRCNTTFFLKSVTIEKNSDFVAKKTALCTENRISH